MNMLDYTAVAVPESRFESVLSSTGLFRNSGSCQATQFDRGPVSPSYPLQVGAEHATDLGEDRRGICQRHAAHQVGTDDLVC